MTTPPLLLEDTLETPPGGWRYEQPETGIVLTSSGGFRGLCKVVRLHREANGLPEGDPALDVHVYLCSKYPDRCRRDVIVIVEKTGFDIRDVKAFLATVSAAIDRRGTDAFVDLEESDRRAAICMTCPYNKKLPGCFGCQSVGRIVVGIIGDRASKWQGRLLQCSICGCANEAKVHLNKDLILETQAKDYVFPEWCWLTSRPQGSAE